MALLPIDFSKATQMTPPNVSTDVLRTLHRIHQQLSDLQGRLERGPKQVRAVEAHLEFREGQLAELQAEARVVRMAADAKQLQLKTSEAKIEELKLKLNAAGSNREYQALKDHIAAQQMTNSVLDDEILEAWEKTEQLQEKIAEAEAGQDRARQKSQEVHDEVRQQEPLIRDDVERLQAELKQCESNMPAEIRELYDRVVRQKGEDALAAVENEYCSGCHQHVPLNVIAEIMLGHPMFCRTCGRMLYVPEDAAPQA